MKTSKAKINRNDKQSDNIVALEDRRTEKTGRSMHNLSLPRYSERIASYMAGDRSQLVSPNFADAVDAIGKRQIKVHLLTKHEKDALRGYDE